MGTIGQLDWIPAELRRLRQWVVWKYEDRNGRKTKIPKYVRTWTASVPDPDGKPIRRCRLQNASSDDPSTWMTCEQAVHLHAISEHSSTPLDGIGIMFADDLFGIDLDHCVDPQTGAVDEWARRIVDEFSPITYAEVSPSGTGIKIIGRGRKPDTRCRTSRVPGLEIYDQQTHRYFTLTGRALPGSPSVIGNCQTQLAGLYRDTFPPEPKPERPPHTGTPCDLPDNEIVRKIQQSKQGPKFEALWRGDLTAYAGDHSAGDMALCSILAYWCGGDAGAIDRLFRQSGLMRRKWDRADYRDATITRAVAGCRSFYQPPDYASQSEVDALRAALATLDFGDANQNEIPPSGSEKALFVFSENPIDKQCPFEAKGGGFAEKLNRSDFEDCFQIRRKLRDGESESVIHLNCNRLTCESCGPAIKHHFGHAIHKWEKAYTVLLANDDPVAVKKVCRRVIRYRKRHGTGGYVCVRSRGAAWIFANVPLKSATEMPAASTVYGELVTHEGVVIRSSRDLAYRHKPKKKPQSTADRDQLLAYVPRATLRAILKRHRVASNVHTDGCREYVRHSFSFAGVEPETRRKVEDDVIAELNLSQLLGWLTSGPEELFEIVGWRAAKLPPRTESCDHRDPATWVELGDKMVCRHCGGFVGHIQERRLP